jgi:hypothetical protein
MKSDFLKLNWQDIVRGLLVAILTAAFIALQPIVERGTLPTLEELKAIGIVGISAGLAYLMKNFLTNSKDKMFKDEKLR